MKSKRFLSAVIVCILLVSLSGMAMAADFTDVPTNHKYYQEIQFCQAQNYINGITPTTFEPDSNLTRGQLAVIICRAQLLQGVPLDVTKGSFNDIVPLKHYYDAAAIIMGCLGAVKGTSDMVFSPEQNLTREQLAVIIMRTLRLGADDTEAYKVYADNASIAGWATEAVSACLNADVFVGLYDGANFMPQTPVTRAEICKLIYTVSQPSHTIKIGTMTGGTVTASQSTAKAGKLITLTVTPEAGKRLKPGTLKYNTTAISGNTFVMPNEDVTIKAQFENTPALQSIAITTMPTKTAYVVGEHLDLTGMVVTATYVGGSTAAVSGWTSTPAQGTAMTLVNPYQIMVFYTENSVTKNTTFSVTVTQAAT
jgi:hypothetical protein